MRASGTSVATETCGQSMPLKFRITFWEYWIWVEVALILRGWVTAAGGVTKNTGAGPPVVAAADSERRLAGSPGRHGEGVLNGLDPEEGGHLRDLRVRLGHVRVAEEEGDVAVPPPNSGLPGVVATPRAVVEQDLLVGGGVAQDGVRVVQDGLGDGTVLDEPGQVLRDPRGMRVAGGLAGEPPDIGGDADRGDRGRAAEGPERALGVERGAVRDRGHPHQGRPLGGVLGRGDVHPHSGLEMDADGLRRVGDVADGQQVTDAVEEDVRCYLAAVGHRSYRPREG